MLPRPRTVSIRGYWIQVCTDQCCIAYVGDYVLAIVVCVESAPAIFITGFLRVPDITPGGVCRLDARPGILVTFACIGCKTYAGIVRAVAVVVEVDVDRRTVACVADLR